MGKSVISCNPEVMGGTAVFSGTRVPVQTLLDYLESGESIDDFLAGFPSVSREQVSSRTILIMPRGLACWFCRKTATANRCTCYGVFRKGHHPLRF
jgi:uncharacterized protein (DUF433 family)